MTLLTILGPSPMMYSIKKFKKCILVRGGQDIPIGNFVPSEIGRPALPIDIESYGKPISEQPRRMTHEELKDKYRKIARVSHDEKLLQSVLDDCRANSASKVLSRESLARLDNLYTFRRKHRFYLRIKRLIPLCLVGPFTNGELSKMAYAAALSSKSVSLTLSGVIGYSLPAFFFFHMSSYYVPDKFKPICQVCKYSVGGPMWLISSLVDEFSSPLEEKYLGEAVPIDLTGTGGTIPADLGNLNLSTLLEKSNKILEDTVDKTFISE